MVSRAKWGSAELRGAQWGSLNNLYAPLQIKKYSWFYSSISTEILRICKTITKFQDFISAKILIESIIKQGGLISHRKRLFVYKSAGHINFYTVFST